MSACQFSVVLETVFSKVYRYSVFGNKVSPGIDHSLMISFIVLSQFLVWMLSVKKMATGAR